MKFMLRYQKLNLATHKHKRNHKTSANEDNPESLTKRKKVVLSKSFHKEIIYKEIDTKARH